MAEEILGQQPTLWQAFIYLKNNYYTPIGDCYEFFAVAISLFREDMILCDNNFLKWTVRKT